ncbi:hypothetical protein Zmor_011779 [Zophobas morio]|jgi:acyl-CoA reductase-like NAD-dependent aldehyde dehydrogenase|uniref:Aldehyde dehydrogenase domain-containing protein n=1 Tax=Zophobas morio TaxID=2755281 RepID=A0AA38HI86_9CUCU|nr:hypothetical protein Zmor_011779 [Zophobas morio]
MVVATWKTEKKLVEKVNDRPYGLGSDALSNDGRALRIAEDIVAKMANINDFGSNYMSQLLPFGGVKCSCFERLGAPEGLRECWYAKALIEDTCKDLAGIQLPTHALYFIFSRNITCTWAFLLSH